MREPLHYAKEVKADDTRSQKYIEEREVRNNCYKYGPFYHSTLKKHINPVDESPSQSKNDKNRCRIKI